MPQSRPPDSSSTVAATGAQNGGAVTGVPASAPGAGGTTVQGGREDLTGFFAIGVIVDVLLVAAFLLWAVGQWRKPKK